MLHIRTLSEKRLSWAEPCFAAEFWSPQPSGSNNLFIAWGSAHAALTGTVCATHFHKPSPVHSHVWNARARYSSSVGGCSQVRGWVWVRLTKGATKSITFRGCCQGIAVMVYLTLLNTPAVSCSLLELKHALFTLTTALKGKIKVDFEVVEFTHWFLFSSSLRCTELWASE